MVFYIEPWAYNHTSKTWFYLGIIIFT